MARADTSESRVADVRPSDIDHSASIADRYFRVESDLLQVGDVPVTDLVEEFGSPLFVYDQSIIKQLRFQSFWLVTAV